MLLSDVLPQDDEAINRTYSAAQEIKENRGDTESIENHRELK
jgi:hypothetical protein